MNRKYLFLWGAVSILALTAAAQHPDAKGMMDAQREGMKALGALDGVWRGPAWTLMPNGEKHTITQTERVGTFLDGTIRVIEGRGYEADGRVSFNAFAVVSTIFSPRPSSARGS